MFFQASIANIGKNISFLSASASRAAIHHSFALKENLADITAKSGSQTIVSSLIGTSVGVMVASQIGDDYSLALTVFSVCSSMNLLLSYLSLRDVNIHAISANHFDFLFNYYRNNSYTDVIDSYLFKNNEFLLGSPSSFYVPVRVGVNVDEAIVTAAEAELVRKLFADEQFVVTVRTHNTKDMIAEVSLLLKEHASESDLLKGLAVAHLCRDSLQQQRHHMLGSQASISYYEVYNRISSKIRSPNDRVHNMTFQDRDVEAAISKINSSGMLCFVNFEI